MAETLNINETLKSWLGQSKNSKEFTERLEQAKAILAKSAGQAELTLQRPSIEESRAVRNLDLETQALKDELDSQRAEGSLGRTVRGIRDIGQVGVDSYAGKAKAATDQSLRVLQPGYDELKAGREMNSADYRYMLDKEYADRDASRDQQRRGDIFNMIKTLGLGGAILLSK